MACRTEARDLPHNATWQQRETAFKKMMSAFNKKLAESGIMQDFRRHETYESPSRKKRRKKKEVQNLLLRQKLKENFPENNRRGDR